MQALDKRDVQNRVIGKRPYNLFYDDRSGNLIAAMGLQGVVVLAPDGTITRVAVGSYSPTDFSYHNKVRTFFGSLLYGPAAVSTGAALLLAFSFAALALVAPSSSSGSRVCFAIAAAISAVLAVSAGVYPHATEAPWETDDQILGSVFLLLSGFGLVPLVLVIVGLVLARAGRKQVLAVVAAGVGMLLVVLLGGLVLFETGASTASFVAVGLVGLATLGLWAFNLWAHKKRGQT